jgi:cytoskeletal protein RodZ
VIVIDVLDGLNPDDYLAGIAEDDLDDEPLEHSRRLSDADPLPATEELPVTPTNMQRRLGRQLSAGMFLVFLAIAIALAVIGTLVAVAITNSTNDTPSTTTTTSSTTSTSSTSSTSTTVPTSTTVSGGGTTNPGP